jgi:hypothetical protein
MHLPFGVSFQQRMASSSGGMMGMEMISDAVGWRKRD